jgi:hypothetical protein
VDPNEAHIRQEMEYTRAAMTTKMDMIQERLEETVEETGSTVVRVMNTVLEQVKRVQDTIETMTSSVDATIERVQDTANKPVAEGKPGIELIADMYQRPWVMMGTAVLMGYILGSSHRSSSTVSPAIARSTSGANLDRFTTDNPTGNPFTPPASSPVGRISTPSPAPMTDAASPP